MGRLPRTLRGKAHDIAWSPRRFTRVKCCHADGRDGFRPRVEVALLLRQEGPPPRDLRLGLEGNRGLVSGAGSIWSILFKLLPWTGASRPERFRAAMDYRKLFQVREPGGVPGW